MGGQCTSTVPICLAGRAGMSRNWRAPLLNASGISRFASWRSSVPGRPAEEGRKEGAMSCLLPSTPITKPAGRRITPSKENIAGSAHAARAQNAARMADATRAALLLSRAAGQAQAPPQPPAGWRVRRRFGLLRLTKAWEPRAAAA